MKQIQRLSVALSIALLLLSCNAQKRVWYIQDAQPLTPEQIVQNGQIRIKPLDQLTVIVNSKDPELAVPFNSYSSLSSLSGSTASASGSQSLQVRTVDEEGFLDMPVIGRIECKGMTRSELARAIAEKIVAGGYINDPTVNVRFANMKVSIIGEVGRPGEYAIERDRISIFDALALAGDITVYGVRDAVTVIRENDGQRVQYQIDLTSKKAFDSPAFYLQQDDVVYIKPNKAKSSTGDVNPNRSFYLSLVGTLISVTTLIVTLTK